MTRIGAFAIAAIGLAFCARIAAGEAPVAPEPGNAPPVPAAMGDAPSPTPSLLQEQKALAEDYARLEKKLRRLAQVSAAADPSRAALLKQAFAESKQRALAGQLEELSRQLDRAAGALPAYDKVLEGQSKATSDMKALVEMLQSESRDRQAEEESRFLRELGQKIGRVIRSQEGIAGRTESNENGKRLADDQRALGEQTAELADAAKERRARSGEAKRDAAEQPAAPGAKAPGPSAPEPSGGNADPAQGENGEGQGGPSQGRPSQGGPSQGEQGQGEEGEASPLERRLREAQRNMEQARKKLEESKHRDASADQQKALDALRAAQAEIEKVLRQMREEHIERTLLALEQRFRAMLDAQIAIYDETKQLDKAPAADRTAEDEIKAGRLGRREQDVVLMCERALSLLREEGSTAALPEATEQVRDDMRRAAELLGQARTDAYTQQIEQDVIAALDDILAAVKQAQADAKANQNRGGTVQPGDPGLVDGLAELKMLRTMQVGVNRRFKQLSTLAKGDDTNDPEILRGLSELAERQKRIVRITRDLVSGRTE